MIRYLLSFALLFMGLASTAVAELKPEQVAILVNGTSTQSKQLAGYYAKVRGIPTSQVCQINMPKGEVLPRSTWEQSIRPAIKNWYIKNNLQDKVKCMVTTWDVPLKISKSAENDLAKQRKKLLELERKRRMERLVLFVGKFNGIAAAPGDAAATTSLNGNSQLKDVTDEISARLRAAETRIQSMPESEKEKQQAAIRELTQLSVATAGLQVITQNLQRAIEAGRGTENMKAEYMTSSGRLAALGGAQDLLLGLPAGIERDTNAIVLVERAAGIVGTISWIEMQLKELENNETHASFDSELALVLQSNHPLLRWVPNYLHYNYDGSPIREVTRTLMVSRLEAPTIKGAKALIDNAINVEKTGLKGIVYLDARGQGQLNVAAARGTIADYDSAVLEAHKLISENTDLEVVLDKEPGLFKEGQCPDAALYCGWYSLSQYIDSFKWNPGSIGYHMSSAEAQTLRKAGSQVWCKRMLDEGITGTLGPVYEPYLLAFPKPNELFALLLSGKYTYIECVYRSKSTNSWTITTIGDPLYNPFKVNPPLKTVPKDYERVLGVALAP